MKVIKPIQYILANCKYGQKKYGVHQAPMKLFKNINKRSLNLNNKYEEIMSNDFELSNYEGYEKLYNIVKKNLKDDKFPVVLGGDHSIASGSVAASFDVYKDNLTLIWMDAHADINTYETSNTGNIHGMPLSSVFNIMDPFFKTDYIPKFNQIIYLGLREVDEGETEILKQHNITHFSMQKIREIGMDNLLESIYEKSNHNVHLSFDVDVLSPFLAPATGTPVKNGMLMYETFDILHYLKDYHTITTFDFVEYNPFLNDKDGKTLENSLKIIDFVINNNK